MSRVEERQADVLDAYWVELAKDPRASIPPDLDPADARVAARLVATLTPPNPDVAFVQRLRRRIEMQEQPTRRMSTTSKWIGMRWQSRAIVMAAVLVMTFTLLGAGVYAAVSLIPSSPPPPASLEDLRVLAQGVDKSAGVAGRKAGYGFVLENPNDDRVAEGATYRVTAFDIRGQELAASRGSIPVILPGQRLGIAGLMSVVTSQSIDRLRVEVDSGDLVGIEAQPSISAREIEYHGGQTPAVTGIVINPYEQDTREVVIFALVYSDEGIIVGGGESVIASMTAGETQSVEVPVTSSRTPGRVELYAALNRLPPHTN